MSAVKNQMIKEHEEFWISLYNTCKNSDNLQECFSLAEELFFICKTSGALYEYGLGNSFTLPDEQLYEDLITDHWNLYIEEIYEMEN